MKQPKIFGAIGEGVKKKQGTLLTIGCIGGTLAAVYFTWRDGPKLMAKLDEFKMDTTMTFKDKAREVGPIIAPAAIATGVSVTCAALNHKYASDTIRTLTDMLTLKNVADETFKKYTLEEAGEETYSKIEQRAALDYAKKTYPSTYNNVGTRVYETGHGQDLFFDSISQNWFRSDINHLKSVVNDLNQQIVSGIPVCLNELYNGWEVPAVDDLDTREAKYWEIDEAGKIDITWYAQLDDTDHAYTLITFNTKPRQCRRRY